MKAYKVKPLDPRSPGGRSTNLKRPTIPKHSIGLQLIWPTFNTPKKKLPSCMPKLAVPYRTLGTSWDI